MLNFKSVNSVAGLIFIGLLILYSFFNLSFWWIFLLLISWLLLTIAGSAFIGWNYHFKSLNSNHKINKNQIAITFDDGPNIEFTPQVLKLLHKYNAKATFFCIGKHIEMYPELFKKIIAQNHTIGNHTFSHTKAFGFLNTRKVISELKQTNAIIQEQTGLEVQLYRPAFGVTNPKIKRAIKTLGLQSIGWNKRSLDTTSLSEKAILNRITRNLKKGDVILLHDSSIKSIAVLEQLLLFLHEQKIESVTIDSLFEIKAYA